MRRSRCSRSLLVARARRGHRARRHLRRRSDRRRSPLPSLTPNAALAVPAALSTPPAVPVQLSYPQLLALWQRAGAAYGIPWQVLASINKVESNFGRNMGPSSAGAIGWMQFMPSTWLRWGVDANGDGVADPWNPTDAIFSAARYLAAAGGDEPTSIAASSPTTTPTGT